LRNRPARCRAESRNAPVDRATANSKAVRDLSFRGIPMLVQSFQITETRVSFSRAARNSSAFMLCRLFLTRGNGRGRVDETSEIGCSMQMAAAKWFVTLQDKKIKNLRFEAQRPGQRTLRNNSKLPKERYAPQGAWLAWTYRKTPTPKSQNPRCVDGRPSYNEPVLILSR
jgi:hypothetical protein